MHTDPIARFRRWFAAARRAGIALPEALALGTAGVRGRVSVRFVLLKQVDPRGLVFFTSRRSRKAADLRANPQAAATFYWNALGRQVRFEGRVREVSAREVDAYWRTRPRASQLAACASAQSAPLASRAVLLARWRALRRAHRGRAVPRPATWTGYRLVPDAVEFWSHRDHRLHDRELFVRTRRGWRATRLQP